MFRLHNQALHVSISHAIHSGMLFAVAFSVLLLYLHLGTLPVAFCFPFPFPFDFPFPLNVSSPSAVVLDVSMPFSDVYASLLRFSLLFMFSVVEPDGTLLFLCSLTRFLSSFSFSRFSFSSFSLLFCSIISSLVNTLCCDGRFLFGFLFF